jgi:hypothetical protein
LREPHPGVPVGHNAPIRAPGAAENQKKSAIANAS